MATDWKGPSVAGPVRFAYVDADGWNAVPFGQAADLIGEAKFDTGVSMVDAAKEKRRRRAAKRLADRENRTAGRSGNES